MTLTQRRLLQVLTREYQDVYALGFTRASAYALSSIGMAPKEPKPRSNRFKITHRGMKEARGETNLDN